MGGHCSRRQLLRELEEVPHLQSADLSSPGEEEEEEEAETLQPEAQLSSGEEEEEEAETHLQPTQPGEEEVEFADESSPLSGRMGATQSSRGQHSRRGARLARCGAEALNEVVSWDRHRACQSFRDDRCLMCEKGVYLLPITIAYCLFPVPITTAD